MQQIRFVSLYFQIFFIFSIKSICVYSAQCLGRKSDWEIQKRSLDSEASFFLKKTWFDLLHREWLIYFLLLSILQEIRKMDHLMKKETSIVWWKYLDLSFFHKINIFILEKKQKVRENIMWGVVDSWQVLL